MKDQVLREKVAYEEFCREIVHAARAEQEIINAAADSPFLFQQVRAQLAAEATTPAAHNLWASLFAGARSRRWAVAATALSMVIALLILTRGARKTMPEPPAPTGAEASANRPPMPVQFAPPLLPEAPKMNAIAATGRGKSHAARRKDAQGTEEEMTTEYLPLTYVAYADEADSGHVVRVQVLRAALLSLGVPVSAGPSTELVKADVIVGDDGLARAIRLVR